jgi:hypothetical protein
MRPQAGEVMLVFALLWLMAAIAVGGHRASERGQTVGDSIQTFFVWFTVCGGQIAIVLAVINIQVDDAGRRAAANSGGAAPRHAQQLPPASASFEGLEAELLDAKGRSKQIRKGVAECPTARCRVLMLERADEALFDFRLALLLAAKEQSACPSFAEIADIVGHTRSQTVVDLVDANLALESGQSPRTWEPIRDAIDVIDEAVSTTELAVDVCRR